MSADEVRTVLDAVGGQTHDRTWAEASRGLARDTRPLFATSIVVALDIPNRVEKRHAAARPLVLAEAHRRAKLGARFGVVVERLHSC